MPIKPELRPLYPADWRAVSHRVRFERAKGRCQHCKRPHGATIANLADGRWFDPEKRRWRRSDGKPARWPDLLEGSSRRHARVVLAAAHLDHDPRNNRLRNLRALCQRCHLRHDLSHHLAQRRITIRMRYALGDLFLGLYGAGISQHPMPPRWSGGSGAMCDHAPDPGG